MKELTTFETFHNLKTTESRKLFDHDTVHYAVHRECKYAMSSDCLQIYQISRLV